MSQTARRVLPINSRTYQANQQCQESEETAGPSYSQLHMQKKSATCQSTKVTSIEIRTMLYMGFAAKGRLQFHEYELAKFSVKSFI
jgi:hypothetical protein